MYVVYLLKKCICHPTTDDQFINFVKHIIDQLDLVANLGTRQKKGITLTIYNSLNLVWNLKNILIY